MKCPVHSHWARLGWFWCLPNTWLGKMSALLKQPSAEGDRWILFWQPVRPALGPSWTMRTTSNLPSWHVKNVNSQFSICLGNYQFWSKSFWYAELWVLQMDFDTSILSSAWPERLTSGLRTICWVYLASVDPHRLLSSYLQNLDRWEPRHRMVACNPPLYLHTRTRVVLD